MMNRKMRPTSPARAAASARNGALSRGPATPQGRFNIAASNTRHGFFARAVVLADEDADAFNELSDSLIARFQPQDPYELRLVRTIAASAWRLERLYDLQTADLQHSIDRQAPTLDREYASLDHETRAALAFRDLPASYLRYESSLLLQQRRALDLLERTRQQQQQKLPALPDNVLIPIDRDSNENQSSEPE